MDTKFVNRKKSSDFYYDEINDKEDGEIIF